MFMMPVLMFKMKKNTRIDIGNLLVIGMGHMAWAPEGGKDEVKRPKVSQAGSQGL